MTIFDDFPKIFCFFLREILNDQISAVSRNKVSPIIMWSPFQYSVFRLLRPDLSERVERSPSCKRIPMNRTKLSPLKNNPPWT